MDETARVPVPDIENLSSAMAPFGDGAVLVHIGPERDELGGRWPGSEPGENLVHADFLDRVGKVVGSVALQAPANPALWSLHTAARGERVAVLSGHEVDGAASHVEVTAFARDGQLLWNREPAARASGERDEPMAIAWGRDSLAVAFTRRTSAGLALWLALLDPETGATRAAAELIPIHHSTNAVLHADGDGFLLAWLARSPARSDGPAGATDAIRLTRVSQALLERRATEPLSSSAVLTAPDITSFDVARSPYGLGFIVDQRAPWLGAPHDERSEPASLHFVLVEGSGRVVRDRTSLGSGPDPLARPSEPRILWNGTSFTVLSTTRFAASNTLDDPTEVRATSIAAHGQATRSVQLGAAGAQLMAATSVAGGILTVTLQPREPQSDLLGTGGSYFHRSSLHTVAHRLQCAARASSPPARQRGPCDPHESPLHGDLPAAGEAALSYSLAETIHSTVVGIRTIRASAGAASPGGVERLEFVRVDRGKSVVQANATPLTSGPAVADAVLVAHGFQSQLAAAWRTSDGGLWVVRLAVDGSVTVGPMRIADDALAQPALAFKNDALVVIWAGRPTGSGAVPVASTAADANAGVLRAAWLDERGQVSRRTASQATARKGYGRAAQTVPAELRDCAATAQRPIGSIGLVCISRHEDDGHLLFFRLVGGALGPAISLDKLYPSQREPRIEAVLAGYQVSTVNELGRHITLYEFDGQGRGSRDTRSFLRNRRSGGTSDTHAFLGHTFARRRQGLGRAVVAIDARHVLHERPVCPAHER